MPLLEEDAPTVNVEQVASLPTRQGAHKYADLRITGLTPSMNTVEVPIGAVGMKRVEHANVQALGQPFRVAWHGDGMNTDHLTLTFDEWPEHPDNVRVRVELHGI